MAQSSGPFLTRFISGVSPPWRLIQSLTGRRVVGHQIGGAGIAHDLHAEGPGLVDIGLVEAKARLRRHADPVERHDAEHQRTGRIADAVDDHALFAIADLCVFGLVLLDQAAEIARDAVIGKRRRTNAAELDSTSRRNARPRIDPVTPGRPWRFMPHPRGENLSVIHWYLVKRLVTVSPHFIAAGGFVLFHSCVLRAGLERHRAGQSLRRGRDELIEMVSLTTPWALKPGKAEQEEGSWE